LCMGHKNIEVPSDNVGAWRGIFEPSTATLEVECKRARKYPYAPCTT
jgi:hypothetical protein